MNMSSAKLSTPAQRSTLQAAFAGMFNEGSGRAFYPNPQLRRLCTRKCLISMDWRDFRTYD